MKYTFYKIICLDDNITEVYVGSTKNFTRRKCEHKSKSINHHYKIYQFIRNNGGWDNFNMIPIREEECETKIQALIIEESIRCDLKAKLNSNRSHITEEQFIERQKNYYENNKVRILEQKKVYTEQNRELINIKKNAFRQANKDIINASNREKYETSKIDINAKRREKYNLVKEEMNEKRREKHSLNKLLCECGGKYVDCHKVRHENSKKHQIFINGN